MKNFTVGKCAHCKTDFITELTQKNNYCKSCESFEQAALATKTYIPPETYILKGMALLNCTKKLRSLKSSDIEFLCERLIPIIGWKIDSYSFDKPNFKNWTQQQRFLFLACQSFRKAIELDPELKDQFVDYAAHWIIDLIQEPILLGDPLDYSLKPIYIGKYFAVVMGHQNALTIVNRFKNNSIKTILFLHLACTYSISPEAANQCLTIFEQYGALQIHKQIEQGQILKLLPLLKKQFIRKKFLTNIGLVFIGMNGLVGIYWLSKLLS